MAGKRRQQPRLPDNAYVLAVEADNDRLRSRVEELERELAKFKASPEFTVMTPVAKFGLTPSESGIFGRLAATGFSSNADLLAACVGKGNRSPQMKVVDVYICKIRRKVEPFDIVIETVHGRGYKIGPESMARIAAIQAGTDIAMSR